MAAARAPLDGIGVFAGSRGELERRLPRLQAALAVTGRLWIARPKRASGVSTDLTGDVVREIGLATGLVDTKVCAIDRTWSGLQVVVRVADRPPAAR